MATKSAKRPRLFRKSILQVGTYESPDGTVVVTPDRLKNWVDTHKRLASNGQVVPVAWDHEEDPLKAIPLSRDEFRTDVRSAASTVGRLHDMSLTQDGNAVEITLDLRDAQARKSARTNSVFVSPVIFDKWQDGTGASYDDVITHVDLVNHPVDSTQTEFEVASGARGGDGATLMSCIRMGLGKCKDGKTPRVYRFASMTYAPDQLGGTDPTDPNETPTVGPTEEDLRAQRITEMGYEDLSAELNQALRDAGFAHMSADPMSNPEQFIRELLAMLRQKRLDEGGLEDGMVPDPNNPEEPEVREPEVAAMSLKVKTSEERSQRLERKMIADGRKRLSARLDNLLATGRVTPKEHELRSRRAGRIRLSLNKNGELSNNRLLNFIEDRESLPEGAVLPIQQRLSQAASVKPNVDTLEDMTPEAAKEFVDKQASRYSDIRK